MCWGRRWTSQDRKNVYLSPYVEEPLNSKVIKSFVPELRSRKCFLCFGIPMFYVYMLWTFYVHFTDSCMGIIHCKKYPLSWWHYINVFFNHYYINFQDMQSFFFEFLVSVINHYYVNELRLLWDSFEWFCLQISSDTKYFSSLGQCIVIKD